jgi:uncharacterized protein (TIGR02588 family)
MTYRKKNSRDNPDRNIKNALEWSVFGISCVLILGVFIYLVADAQRSRVSDPNLETRITSVEKRPDKTLAEILVTNRGGSTAADLTVRLVADFPAGPQEAEIGFDFVPRNGTRRARVEFFSTETARSIAPGIHSYREP